MSTFVGRGVGGGGGGHGRGFMGPQWDGERATKATRMRNLRGLVALIRPYRLRAAATLLALVLGTAAALAPPLLARAGIDRGIQGKDTTALVVITLVFLVDAALVWALTYAQTYLVGWVGQRVLADLRIRIFTHLQTLPIGFYESRRAGVLISRITNDVEALDSLVTDSVVTLFQSGLTLVGAIGVLLYLDPGLALLTFCVVPLLAAGSLWFRLASAGAFRRTRETIGAITAYLQETLSGVRVVRTFAQEPRHEAEFAALNEDNRAANWRTVQLNARYFPTVEMLSGIALALIVLYGGYQAIAGHITAGTVVAFVATLSYLFDPIQQLSQLYATYQSGMAALEKIFQLLDVRPDLSDRPDAVELGRIAGAVSFEGVSFAYRRHGAARRRAATNNGEPAAASIDGNGGASTDDVLALDGIDLRIPPGQTVALVGATGAGKSTLAKLAARFYDPTAGAVTVDGHDLRDVSVSSLRSQMGIVPQEAFLFGGTIRENIAFGRPDASDEQVREAAKAVGADAFVSELPDGYDTEVGERGSQLSAGQRQLVAFARALIADPRVLILDEATSNVDLHTEGHIEAGLRRLLAGRTAIVIAHRLSTIRQAGRIVVLEHGKIAEEGTHDELIALEGRYFALYRDWALHAAA